jgi:hypothetical protein
LCVQEGFWREGHNWRCKHKIWCIGIKFLNILATSRVMAAVKEVDVLVTTMDAEMEFSIDVIIQKSFSVQEVM